MSDQTLAVSVSAAVIACAVAFGAWAFAAELAQGGVEEKIVEACAGQERPGACVRDMKEGLEGEGEGE